MIQAVSAQLQALRPERASVFVQREADTIAQLQQAKQAWSKALVPYQSTSFIVMHDAYHYFEQSFGLSAAGTIHVNPEIPPSIRRMQQLRQMLAERQVRCVFKEPQFPESRLTGLLKGMSVSVGSLDPLGADGQVRSYFEFYDRLVQDFIACFQTS
jgi:zinc transport system substrate-binding protein